MVMYRDPLVQLQESFEEARGLFEAGKSEAALLALARIPERYQVNPDILEFRCHLYLAAKQWALAADLAKRLAETAPTAPGHWISWAFAVRRLQSIDAAEKILRAALVAHPECATIHFNLACYAAQTGRLPEAATLLQAALRLEPAMADQAANDPDLLPLFEQPSSELSP